MMNQTITVFYVIKFSDIIQCKQCLSKKTHNIVKLYFLTDACGAGVNHLIDKSIVKS